MTIARRADQWLERRIFLDAPAGLALIAILAALSAIAILSAGHAAAKKASAIAAFTEETAEEHAAFRETLAEIERSGVAQSPYDAQPFNIRLAAVMPSPSLAPLGGGEELFPSTVKIGASRSAADLFSGYEFANPTLLASGRFDMTFVVVVILPLLMIAASFDALAGERRSGRARLAAAQGGDIGVSAARRIALRNAILFGVLAAAAAIGVPATGGALTGALAAWLAAAGVYALFWQGVILCAVAWTRAAETTATVLATVWMILAFALPAGIDAAGEAIHLPPSRLAFLSEMRAAKADAARESERLRKDYFEDHPDLFVSDESLPAYYTNAYLANLEVEKRTAPLAAAFEESRRRRARFADALQFLSPPLIAERALTAIAGADADRAFAFQEQARAALIDLQETVSPAILSRKRLSLAEVDAISPFTFREAAPRNLVERLLAPLGFLLLVAAALLAAARARFSAPIEKLL